jgi:phosphatidylglycerol:prolipoprotein diacylglycerol transferase
VFPFHLKLGPLAIGPGEIFTVLAAALVGTLARRRLALLAIGPGDLFDLALGALAGGAVGARLFYFVPLWLRGMEGAVGNGSGYYGGFIGGVFAVALVARFKKRPGLQVLDGVVAPLPLGFAVGKIGCFLAGCCYGPRSAAGVSFRSGSLCFETQRKAGESVRQESLPVAPTQLVEMGLGILLFIGLLLLQRRSKRPGDVFAAYVLGYSVWRFVIEFFRDDPGRHGFGGGLSDSQITALLLGTVVAVAWAWIVRQTAERGVGAPK